MTASSPTCCPRVGLTTDVSSRCAGLAATTKGTPADVVKARVINQPLVKAGQGMYNRGVIDCLIKTVRMEGLFSLKGFAPCWLCTAPCVGCIQCIVYVFVILQTKS